MTTDRRQSRAPRASAVTLPSVLDPPPTVLDFLVERFPRIDREIWQGRMANGKVLDDADRALDAATPYRVGLRVRYFREVEHEPEVPFQETIVFRNDRLLVVDKPHFLPVVPSGSWVNECLLYRLQRSTGLEALTPVHRLDRLTAGLVMFSIDASSRGSYHRLFDRQEVQKDYLALAHAPERPERNHWRIENRLGRGEPWFRMTRVDGQVNAVTEVELLNWQEGIAHFRLRPETGKQHQLRVHLAGLGYPIVDDPIYPTLQPKGAPDFERPLRLLAERLRFRDPVTGQAMDFQSGATLELPASRA
ncbi:MAG: pseudouridine synthase [Acidobacteriota bacterium]